VLYVYMETEGDISAMQRERVTDNIFVFTSDLYAQVTAGLVVTDEGAVLIDTLAYPAETLRIKQFAEDRLRTVVRYVVNTHYHADHTTGTCLFDGAEVIGHVRCRDLLNTRGRAALEQARSQNTERMWDEVELILPNRTFERDHILHIGGQTLRFWSTPGHSTDSIVCLVENEQVLFAADTLMPIPYFVDGDYDQFLSSLQGLLGQGYEAIVQGHGEVILRGEVDAKIKSDISYLKKLRKKVDAALASDDPAAALTAIHVQSCGKSRVLLNGMVEQLHESNVKRLAKKRRPEGIHPQDE